MKTVCQLNDFFFTKLSINWVQSDKDEIVVASLASKFDYDVWVNPEDDHQYMMRFWTRFSEETAEKEALGHQIEIELYGNFTIDDSIDEKKRPLLVRQNGVSILLGIVRGQIASATGIFPGEKLVIPAIMPQDIVEQIESNKKAAKSVAKKKPSKRASSKKAARKKLAASKSGKG